MGTTFNAGFDSATAQNSSLNPVDVSGQSTVEITFIDQDISGGAGDFVLENDPVLGYDTDTVVEITFLGVTATYEFSFVTSGTFPGQPDSANKVPDIIENKRVFIIRIEDFDHDGDPATPGVPTQFYFTPDYEAGTPEADVIGDVTNNAINIGLPNDDPEPVCFLAGTTLETRNGATCVEDLRIGDEVAVAPGGFLPVVWISSSLHQWPGSDAKDKPIAFAPASLGKDAPQSQLCVSPQHHIVVQDALCLTMFGQEEVLAPAKGLTRLPGVRVMQGKANAEYVHVMLPEHAIVKANGVFCESFFPGPTAMKALSVAQRASLFGAVPALKDDPENGYGPTARKKITRRQAEELVQAMLADRKAKAIAAE